MGPDLLLRLSVLSSVLWLSLLLRKVFGIRLCNRVSSLVRLLVALLGIDGATGRFFDDGCYGHVPHRRGCVIIRRRMSLRRVGLFLCRGVLQAASLGCA